VLAIAANECRTLQQKSRRRKEEPGGLDEHAPQTLLFSTNSRITSTWNWH
jgi:hypothetical protein